MEQDKNNEISLIDRITQSKASCSAVIKNREMSSKEYVDGFLDEFREDLEQSFVIVRIDCEQYPDSFAIWKGFADGFKQAAPPGHEWDNDAIDAWEMIEETEDTFIIQDNIITVAKSFFEQTGKRFLLIVENMESLIEKMDWYDSLKFRGLGDETSDLDDTIVLMAISYTELSVLGKQKYGESYFSNTIRQFIIN